MTKDIIDYANITPKLKSMPDDVVDALCLAMTGMVGMENGFKTVPEFLVSDSNGILMQMVYSEC